MASEGWRVLGILRTVVSEEAGHNEEDKHQDLPDLFSIKGKGAWPFKSLTKLEFKSGQTFPG